MKMLTYLIIFLYADFYGFSQFERRIEGETFIDTSLYNKWPKVSAGSISNDGKYVACEIYHFFPYNQKMTVVQSHNGNWKLKLENIINVKFTSNSRNVVYINPGDSLIIQELGTVHTKIIPNVNVFQIFSFKNEEWLIYKSTVRSNELGIVNLDNSFTRKYSSVINYFISPDGKNIVFQKELTNNTETGIEVLNLTDWSLVRIWNGAKFKSAQIIFDKASTQMSFFIGENKKNTIWYYKFQDSIARPIVNTNEAFEKGAVISKLIRFSNDGSLIFFNIERPEGIPVKSNSMQMNLWSYTDLMPQSEQLGDLRHANSLKPITKTYLSVANIAFKQVIQIQKDHEKVLEFSKDDNYCLLRQLNADRAVSLFEGSWSPAYKGAQLYLVSLNNGNRIKLPWYNSETHCSFSPKGKYIIYWEPSLKPDYFSYEISTAHSYNLSSNINSDFTVDDGYRSRPDRTLLPIGGWLKDDGGILLNSRYDIWLVHPLNKMPPKNVTNNYGARHSIMLRLAENNNQASIGQKLLLVAFNVRTKENGYFTTVLAGGKDPKKLVMDNCLFSSYPVFSDFKATHIKARDKAAWLVSRQSATVPFNYFWTNDFRTFEPISNEHAERSYKWLTAEIHTWTTPDGDTIDGVLYKPGDFDKRKKYPVIFTYYRQMTYEVHEFKKPEWATGRINIPWFTSQGYLIFTPDIHHRIPELKKSVVESVMSAANYLTTLSFVDSTRMAIQGHSFGGLETGYLVTNSHRFAAACSASGYYNLTTDVCSVLPHGAVRTTSEDHMGGILWDLRDQFIENSPYYYLNQVSTPILLMTGENDGQVSHNQSVEFFLGLRRLHKPVWMLSYEGEEHNLVNERNMKDYTLRMTQFFDHYLKGLPAPKWMTNGISAKMRNVDNGYDTDITKCCWTFCPICQKLAMKQKAKLN